jgi:hypothetical protein
MSVGLMFAVKLLGEFRRGMEYGGESSKHDPKFLPFHPSQSLVGLLELVGL